MVLRLFPQWAFTVPPYRSAPQVSAGLFCSEPLVLTAPVSRGFKVSPMVIYLPPTCASLSSAATPPPTTLWLVEKFTWIDLLVAAEISKETCITYCSSRVLEKKS